jgi:hypothetical protein
MEDPEPPLAPRPLPGGTLRHKFSKQEDHQICELVQRFGVRDWERIAAAMPGRNARQCRERYKNYLSQSAPDRPWNFRDDLELMGKFRLFGPNWKEIAKFFPNRTNIFLKNRWTVIATRSRKLLAKPRARQGVHAAWQQEGPAFFPFWAAGLVQGDGQGMQSEQELRLDEEHEFENNTFDNDPNGYWK